MLELFKPDIYQKSILDINYKALKEKGIKCIVFDLDNTLVESHKSTLKKEAIKLITNLKKDYKIVILSNSLPYRVKKIANELDVDYYPFSLKPTQRNYKKLKRKINIDSNQIIFIGDQMMTDVLGARRAKAHAALVKPMGNKEFIITRLNRLIEKSIYKKLKMKKGEYYEWKDALAVE